MGNIKYSQRAYIKLNHLTMWDIIKHFSKERSYSKILKMWKFAKKFPYPYKYVSVPKGALKTVALLSKKYKLAIVTARVKSGTASVLKRYGYEKYIKTIVTFEDCKQPKPHPESLLIALKKLKVKHNEAYYVGDMESDILCAKAAGVKSVLFRNFYSNDQSTPDYEVKSFAELLKALN